MERMWFQMPEKSLTVRQKDGHMTYIYPYLCEAPPAGRTDRAASDTLSVPDGERFSGMTASGKAAYPVASVLILHGMAEHHERYEAFARFLNAAGLDVYLYDHRGHGTAAKLEDLGHLSSSRGYEKIMEDALAVVARVREIKRTPDYFIFGHSMGSIITRCVLQRDDAFTGAVICGSTYPAKLTIAGGLLVSRLLCLLKGPEHRSPFLNHLLFESKPYMALSDRTVMDWLTRDHVVVGAYIADPYCGFLCSTSFYHDLIKLSSIAGAGSGMCRTKKELPLFFLSGSDDPVGGCGKQIRKLSGFYQKHGYSDVTLKLYPEGRHELLNELNKEEVMNDLAEWFLSKCTGSAV